MEVFIVPYDKTMDIDTGFTKQKHSKDIWNKYNNIGNYIDKEIADNSIAMQQIIPYVLLKNEEGKYYSASLVTKDKTIISIGFGDNITPADGVLQPLFKGAVRTLLDNVVLEELKPMKYLGTVRDKAVNSKYVGYVFIIEDVNDVKLVNEKLHGEWLSKQDLIDKYGQLEKWSQHIVNYMIDNT